MRYVDKMLTAYLVSPKVELLCKVSRLRRDWACEPRNTKFGGGGNRITQLVLDTYLVLTRSAA